MKMAVFWDVAPCSLVEIEDVSEVFTAFVIRAIALVMGAISISETSVSFYQTTRHKPC
jgi:hypothetical protein